ncbi:hypothetical protein DP939_25265 [Spongiactinospora rosea]|uniref:Protein involved in plasmid replication-relaxation n=1 Tax=Spongiactinospora rosea TaxID=2248750 RepID=A0A366LTK2_9ACTN|nr:replication-relaxation family protein [Spongiactinospora rosea]RBQ17258.1 hypothetical protein DP939_25265 [Spongiactinospora rosea]
MPPPREHAGPGRIDPAPRRQLDHDLLAQLTTRLTERDLWLLNLLHEHRVLTLPQITQLAFPSRRAAAHRLLTLYQHTAVDRFRPARPLGSAPHHYLLGPAGAAVLSQRHDTDIGHRAEHVTALAHSAKLTHLVGCNGFFTALIAHSRNTTASPADGQSVLEQWWNEKRCAQSWGHTVQPDGYGRWRQSGRIVDFFLEYDTGSEPLARLTGKVHDYLELADATGIYHTAVLFALPSIRREHHLHDHLGHHGRSMPIPIATTNTALLTAHGPARAIWQTLDNTSGDAEHRTALIDLPISRSAATTPPAHNSTHPGDASAAGPGQATGRVMPR